MGSPRIHHFAITAPAEVLEEVIKFYGDTLELTPGPRPDFGIPGYWLYAGDQPIVHLLQDDNRQPGDSGFHDHVALRCEDLAGTRARLDALGVDYGEMSIADLGQTQLFIKDPAGSAIELNFEELP